MANRITKKNNSFKFSIEKTTGKSKYTFVFIHDIGFDKRFWFPIMTDIGADVCAVSYDLDGFGANAATLLAHHTLTHHVDNLFSVLAHLRIKNPVLIGIRFGAYVALQAIKKDVEYFNGLMIGGVLPYTATYDEYTELSELVSNLGRRGKSEVYADYIIDKLDIDTDNSSRLHHQISTGVAENIAATLTASLTRTSALDALLSFSHPVCLLVGRNQEERLQKECINISFNNSNMSIVRIPESTTLYNLENPKAFRSAMSRFINLFEKK